MWKVLAPLRHKLPFICAFTLCAPQMYSQTANTGAIAGSVNDPSGRLVRAAALVVRSQATQEERDLSTDAEGNFSVPFLAPGKYDLTVRAPGFESFVLKRVQVQITEVGLLTMRLTS